MNKRLYDAICDFCNELTNWEEKREFYIAEVLPTLVDRYNHSAISSKARLLFMDIWNLASGSEWNNIINLIIEIKETPDKELEKQIEKARAIFTTLKRKYNFQGFIHTTAYENFINIMKLGKIYSRKLIFEKNIEHKNIALNEVLNTTPETIKSFARFYWRVKTPTCYRNEGIKPQAELVDNFKAHSPNPVILVIDENIAFEKDCRFTPINACKCQTIFDLTDLAKFDFEKIFHKNVISSNEINKEIILARNAEMLYPQSLPTDAIKKIIFRSFADYDRAILELGEDSRFVVDPSQFFNNWLYVENYKIKIKEKNIKLNINYNFGQEFLKHIDYMFGSRKFKHSILFLDKNFKIIEIFNVNNQIYDNKNCTQVFEFTNKPEYKFLCYHIDNIECIKAKIND